MLELVNARGSQRIVVRRGPEVAAGGAGDLLSVEWLGRLGRPTSYALLGGRLATGEGDGVLLADAPPDTSHPGAEPGLPDEYRDAVAAGCPPGVRVTVAAHDVAGSSRACMFWTARLLGRLVAEGVPAPDEVWTAWAGIRAEPYPWAV
jgi:hypothetical protein